MELISSARAGRDAVRHLQPAHQIDEADVEGDGVEHRQPGEAGDQAPMVAQRLDDRRPLAALRRRILRHVPAQEIAGDPQHGAEQERDAPAPGFERGGRHRRRETGAHRRAEQDAGAGAARRQRAQQAAPALWSVLDQEHHRAGVFAADRQPLHHAQQRERDRRQDAERRIARQQPDQDGRDRHGGDREGERRAPPEPVADMADDGAADRPHQVADREHPEGGEQLGDRILVREEMAADLSCEIAVDREIVPFEHVADGAGGDHPPCLRTVHRNVRIRRSHAGTSLNLW